MARRYDDGSQLWRHLTHYNPEIQDREEGDPIWRLAYPAPDPSDGTLRFSHARRELASAQLDLLRLAAVDAVAAAVRVRRIQCDQRRLWWPPIKARLHPGRPRLKLHDQGEDE